MDIEKKVKTVFSQVFLVMVLLFWGTAIGSADVVDRIVAIVNDDIITLVELNKATAAYHEKINTGSFSDVQKKNMITEVNENALQALIDQSLTHQEARRYNIRISENEVNRAIDNILKSRSLTMEALRKALAQEGVEFEEYKENIEKQILQNRLINHAVKSKVVVLESDIEKYYEAHKDQYAGQQKYHLRNILMESESQIKTAKSKLDGGQDFAQVAQAYSEAPNALDGGDLGLFDVQAFPEKIKDSILQLSADQYTDVILTPQGYQIFYVQDIAMEQGKSYEDVHDEIHKKLYDEKIEKKFITWHESLKKKAHIKSML